MMTIEDKQRALRMIRSDELVGDGSCSCIDEAYTDEELMEEIIDKVDTPTEALEIAKRVHRTHEEIQDEMRMAMRSRW